MSCDKFSIDDESVNRIAEAVNKINKNKSDSNQTPLEPYIQDLIPWIQNLDKRMICKCNFCEITFIGHIREQKYCSNTCRAKFCYRRKNKPKDTERFPHLESLYEQMKKRNEAECAGLSQYVDYIDNENPNDKGRD